MTMTRTIVRCGGRRLAVPHVKVPYLVSLGLELVGTWDIDSPMDATRQHRMDAIITELADLLSEFAQEE